MVTILTFLRLWGRGYERRPIFLEHRSSSWAIILAVSVAVFTDVFLYGVIVPVMPFALQSRLGISPDKVQYWVSVLLAVFGASLLASSAPWGYLADRISNRRAFMIFGLLLLTGATVFLCVSSNIAMLIIGRILQGTSGALVWTIGMALIVDTVDGKTVGMAMGWVGMSMSLATLAAPMVGGVIHETAGYYQVFFVCFGLLAVDIVLRLAIIEAKDAARWLEVNPADPVHITATGEPGVISPSLAITSSDDKTSPVVPTSTTETYPRAETMEPLAGRPSRVPQIFRLLRNRRLLAALWGTLVYGIITTSFDGTLPLFVHETFLWSSLGAGLVFLPLVLPTFLSPLIGAGSDRWGPKWFAVGGFLLAVPFLVCLRFVSQNTMTHKVILCVMLTGTGIALALVFGPLMAEITWAVEAEEAKNGGRNGEGGVYAQAYALFTMAYSGGAMVGPIMGGMIRESAGWGTVGWTMGLVAGVTAVIQGIWVGDSLGLPTLSTAAVSSEE